MSTRRIWRGTAPLLLAIPAMTGNALAQSTKVIDVNEPRPLWRALDTLETVVGSTINYEDPPFENMADCQDAATPQQRAAQPAGWRLIVPRDGHVTAEVRAPATGTVPGNDVIFDVGLLLASYRRSNLPGDFKIEQANGAVYVTPTKVLGADGAIRDVTSPLVIRVTIPNAQRTVVETTEAILEAVHKATGLRIVMGAFPYWPVETVGFGASGEPARDALARLFAQTAAAPLSYRLVFEPRPDLMRDADYVLNVRRTAYVAPIAPLGAAPTAMPAPLPKGVPGNSPFRTKVPE